MEKLDKHIKNKKGSMDPSNGKGACRQYEITRVTKNTQDSLSPSARDPASYITIKSHNAEINKPIKCYIALTFNPHPLSSFNRRQYRNYTQIQQGKLLLKIENASRRETTIEKIELELEICPSMRQVHFHALYLMEPKDIDKMRDYYEKYDYQTQKDKASGRQYIAYVLKIVDNKEGWIAYIKKNHSDLALTGSKEPLAVGNSLINLKATLFN